MIGNDPNRVMLGRTRCAHGPRINVAVHVTCDRLTSRKLDDLRCAVVGISIHLDANIIGNDLAKIYWHSEAEPTVGSIDRRVPMCRLPQARRTRSSQTTRLFAIFAPSARRSRTRCAVGRYAPVTYSRSILAPQYRGDRRTCYGACARASRAVEVARAIGFIVLVAVADKIFEREAVMHCDLVYARPRAPAVVRVFSQRNTLEFSVAGGVKKTELDPVGILRENSEVHALAVPRRANGRGFSRPDTSLLRISHRRPLPQHRATKPNHRLALNQSEGLTGCR